MTEKLVLFLAVAWLEVPLSGRSVGTIEVDDVPFVSLQTRHATDASWTGACDTFNE